MTDALYPLALAGIGLPLVIGAVAVTARWLVRRHDSQHPALAALDGQRRDIESAAYRAVVARTQADAIDRAAVERLLAAPREKELTR